MFLYTLLLFLRSTLLLNRNKHIGEEFFVFYKFALSISTDMIIEIQMTKLIAKLPIESHWR